jgi:hypothetical protein
MWQARVSQLGVVMLVLGMLLVPRTAHAQDKRLEIFANYGGQIHHHWSDDAGRTWSQWLLVPPTVRYVGGAPLSFVGQPAVASGAPGVIRIAARTTDGVLVENVYFTSDGGYTSWLGWWTVRESFQGGVCVDNKGCWTWLADSYPALSSWGVGDTELFINARRSDGAIGLLHTWQINGEWSDHWELLGTGLMQGSPTAVSWARGRTDVFVRGGGNELSHKWFANGKWSSGWENLGGYQTASPAAISRNAGLLQVFVRGGDGALWTRFFTGLWSNWESLGGYIGDGTSPTAAARSYVYAEAFVLGADRLTLFQNSFNQYYGWAGFVARDPYAVWPAALAWRPLPGQQEY